MSPDGSARAPARPSPGTEPSGALAAADGGPAGTGAGPVRTGVIVPTFQEGVGPAREAARLAEAAGVDGIFCYDHLWPLGQPERPALAPFPLLGALAASTRRAALGPLVARVGLVPDDVLVAEVDALVALAPGRVVIGLGTGDRLSAGENEAYGIDYLPAASRRASLRACLRAVRDRGVPVWVGDGSAATLAIGREEGTAVNLWDAPPARVAAEAARGEVTWAGPSPDPRRLRAQVAELGAAGATWVVYGWPVDVEELAAAAAAVRPAPAGSRPGWEAPGR